MQNLTMTAMQSTPVSVRTCEWKAQLKVSKVAPSRYTPIVTHGHYNSGNSYMERGAAALQKCLKKGEKDNNFCNSFLPQWTLILSEESIAKKDQFWE